MLEVDNCVGPEGEFAGHAWLEIGQTIVDVPSGFCGSLIIDGQARVCPWRQRAYVVIPRLSASIQRHWGKHMKAIGRNLSLMEVGT